jgi:hypothetical protein
MYRYERRGRWKYLCALYQNSQANCCRYNVVDGPAATRFLLAAIAERILTPERLKKLRARLRELAVAEVGDDPGQRKLDADRAELASVKRKIETIGRNMALAETVDVRQATSLIFREWKQKETELEQRIAQGRPAIVSKNPDHEVALALKALDRITELLDIPDSDMTSPAELFRSLNVRMYLRFQQPQNGRKKRNALASGIVTFGTSPPRRRYMKDQLTAP